MLMFREKGNRTSAITFRTFILPLEKGEAEEESAVEKMSLDRTVSAAEGTLMEYTIL